MQCLKKLINNNYRKQMIIALTGIIGVLLLVKISEKYEVEFYNEQSQKAEELSYFITKADANTQWVNPNYVDLSSISEKYVIKEGGDYVLSGEYDSTLCIDAQDQIVHLFLDNVSIHSLSGSAIDVVSAGKVIITLVDGTENTLEGAYKEAEKTEKRATLHSETDLTINGDGTLNVYAYYKDAVRTKDILKIVGGNIYAKSKKDGLRGSDGIYLINTDVKIESEGSGIVTTNIGKKNKGAIGIEGAKISIVAGEYGIVCAENLHVNSSDIYCKSIIEDKKVDGEIFIEEGSFTNE